MAVYTYVVDHGDQTPRIGASTRVNGGRLQSVMFDDALAQIEVHEDFLRQIRDHTTDAKIRLCIDAFFGNPA